jgi:hypothetical protein
MTGKGSVPNVMDNTAEVIKTIWSFFLGTEEGGNGKGILQKYFGFVLSEDHLSIIFLGDNKPFEMQENRFRSGIYLYGIKGKC